MLFRYIKWRFIKICQHYIDLIEICQFKYFAYNNIYSTILKSNIFIYIKILLII